jgi:hypothetical protein
MRKFARTAAIGKPLIVSIVSFVSSIVAAQTESVLEATRPTPFRASTTFPPKIIPNPIPSLSIKFPTRPNWLFENTSPETSRTTNGNRIVRDKKQSSGIAPSLMTEPENPTPLDAPQFHFAQIKSSIHQRTNG